MQALPQPVHDALRLATPRATQNKCALLSIAREQTSHHALTEGTIMLWSHGWDLFLKVIWLIAAPILVVVLHIDALPQSIGLTSGTVIGIIGVALWILIYRQVFTTIASWLYARLSLGASVSLGEAHQLRRLFQTDFSFKWVPLKEVKQLPKEQRRDAVLAALARLGPGRKAMLF